MPTYNFNLSTLIPGTFNSAGLFVAGTLESGKYSKSPVARDQKIVFRGPCIAGPLIGGVTSAQYIYPSNAELVQNTHFFMRKGTTILAASVDGDVATPAYQNDGMTPVLVTTTVLRNQPGQILVESGVPTYWYLVLDPRGASELLDPLEIAVFEMVQTLPYAIATIVGSGEGV